MKRASIDVLDPKIATAAAIALMLIGYLEFGAYVALPVGYLILITWLGFKVLLAKERVYMLFLALAMLPMPFSKTYLFAGGISLILIGGVYLFSYLLPLFLYTLSKKLGDKDLD